MKVVIVVPTIREQNIKGFLAAWQQEFASHSVIVVEDNPKRTFDVSGSNVKHFCWTDIDGELGHASWIIPRQTDCIRSFGYYKAYASGAEVIVTLDDDCHPQGESFISQHLDRLTQSVQGDAWVSTGRGVRPRGMPYHNVTRTTECVVNHGLWEGIPGFDAITQLANVRFCQEFEPLDQVIPKGMFFPMCGMNLAFKRSLAPAMYFLLMGKDWGFDRFGDIWCGVFLKKICDHLGLAIRSGEPRVKHQRASNVWANLGKELAGYEVNETLWRVVDSMLLTKLNIRDCYKELAQKLPFNGDYWDRLRVAMNIWADLFSSQEDAPQ